MQGNGFDNMNYSFDDGDVSAYPVLAKDLSHMKLPGKNIPIDEPKNEKDTTFPLNEEKDDEPWEMIPNVYDVREEKRDDKNNLRKRNSGLGGKFNKKIS